MRLQSFKVHILCFVFPLTVFAGPGENVWSRFGLSCYGGTTGISQYAVGQSFYTAGYRSTDCPLSIPDSSCSLKPYAAVGISYPDLVVAASWNWSPRIGLRLAYSSSKSSSAYFSGSFTSDHSTDFLHWYSKNSSTELLVDYIVLPYKGKRLIGLQLEVSGGIAFNRLRENLYVRIPSADTASSAFSDQSFRAVRWGTSSVFAFDPEVFIGKNLSLSPIRIVFCLPALQPAFRELTFTNGSVRRFLPSRNYDLTGLVWEYGMTFHF